MVYVAKNIIEKLYEIESLAAEEIVERVKYLLQDDRFMCPKEKYAVSARGSFLQLTKDAKKL